MQARSGRRKGKLCRIQVTERTIYVLQARIPTEYIPQEVKERVTWLQRLEDESRGYFSSAGVSLEEGSDKSVLLILWIVGPNGYRHIEDLRKKMQTFFNDRKLPLNPLVSYL